MKNNIFFRFFPNRPIRIGYSVPRDQSFTNSSDSTIRQYLATNKWNSSYFHRKWGAPLGVSVYIQYAYLPLQSQCIIIAIKFIPFLQIIVEIVIRGDKFIINFIASACNFNIIDNGCCNFRNLIIFVQYNSIFSIGQIIVN